MLDDLGPLTAVGLRCLIGALAVLPFVWFELRAHRASVNAPWRIGELRGIIEVAVLFAGAITLQQAAYQTSTVTNASFLVSTTTVMTPLAVWLLLKTRPAMAIWIAVAAAFTGAILMAGGSLSTMTTGDWLCLGSAALYSIWFVRLGQVVVATGRPTLVTLAGFALAGGLCLAIGLLSEPVTLERIELALPALLFLGVFATGFAYGLQAIAQQFASACVAAVLTSAESVFGAAAAALLLGERLTAPMWLGAVLVVVAIFAAQRVPVSAIAPIRRRERALVAPVGRGIP